MHHATASDAQHATPIPSPNDLLTARDVTTMLGVTTDWVYAQSGKGHIPTITSAGTAATHPPLARPTRTAHANHRSERQISRDCPGRSRALGGFGPFGR
jgi:hypothetical protein